MKRLLCALILPATLGLAGCSGADDESANAASSPAPDGAVATSDATGAGTTAPEPAPAESSAGGDATATAPAAPADPKVVPGPSRTQGAPVVNADQGDTKITECKAGDGGVDITATLKNTTKEKRTYILTAMVYADGKVAGSAALMADDIEPGKAKDVTGRSDKAVKGKVTCEVAQIDSMATS